MNMPEASRPSRPDSKIRQAVQELKGALGHLAMVRAPWEAKEPILAPNVRVAVFQWMHEIRNIEKLEEVDADPRRTALLFGPPGTGKTTLAHHLAARLGIPLVIVGAETLLDCMHGGSEKNLGRLFDGLERAETSSILLMDEIEAIGADRRRNTGGGADNARTSTITVLLRRIEEYKGFAIAATNQPDILDSALWRRFHIQISVDLPGEDERFAILKRYSLPFEVDDDALGMLTDLTAGASPALLESLMKGMKRSLVLNPGMKLPIDKPEQVFIPIITSLKPPPEINPVPPLWADPTSVRELAQFPWPPVFPEKKDAA